MFFDGYRRNINYLRISVTDKCNLRCRYCMPETGIALKRHEDILSLEEISEVAAYAVSHGMTKIRLTGGEPLVRKNVEHLVEAIAELPGLLDFGMTTNGTLLEKYAHELKRRGLHRVNISIDSLDEDKYSKITRGGDLRAALSGIEAAKSAGLTPVKLNVVLINGFNYDEKDDFVAFGEKHDLEVRFISKMDLAMGLRGGIECNAGQTLVGQCEFCNRLRLTCDGLIKPCLFSENGLSVRELGIEEAFRSAIFYKPRSGTKNEREMMYQIGG